MGAQTHRQAIVVCGAERCKRRTAVGRAVLANYTITSTGEYRGFKYLCSDGCFLREKYSPSGFTVTLRPEDEG
jgi:hypothetical protein